MTQIDALPLFPLTSHLFPGGVMPLRIFEARYLRMVRESFHREHAFALCMLDPKGDKASNTHIWPLATLVRIVDFDQLDDGLLGVSVEGVAKLEVLTVSTEKDGLRTGQVRLLPDWQPDPLAEQYQPLASKLQTIYQDYPELGALYPEPKWQDASWLARRWLELLPLEPEQKQQLWGTSPKPALELLQQLVHQQ